MSSKVMKLIDPYSGKMRCRVCGSVHYANLKRGGGYYYGSWQCIYKCRLEKKSEDSSGESFAQEQETKTGE